MGREINAVTGDEIAAATVDDAEIILALQRLAYQSEAAIYDDFTLPPLIETLEELQQFPATRETPENGG